MTDYSQLPEWTSHKVVRAGRIIATGENYEDEPEIARIMVDLGNGKTSVFSVDRKVFARAWPSAGDYLVVYNVGTPDEYVSWSPAKVFVEGNTRK